MRRASPVAAFLMLIALLSCEQKPARTVPAATVADSKSAIVIVGDLPLWTLTQGALTLKETIPIGEKLVLIGPGAEGDAGREREGLPERAAGFGIRGLGPHRLRRLPLDPCGHHDGRCGDLLRAVQYRGHNGKHPEDDDRCHPLGHRGMSFIRVSCFDPAAKVLRRNVSLRNEGVSARPFDVQAAILLQLAAGSKNVKQQKAFLSSAIQDYPESVFAPELQSALDALTSPAPEAAPRPTHPCPLPSPAPAGTASQLRPRPPPSQ